MRSAGARLYVIDTGASFVHGAPDRMTRPLALVKDRPKFLTDLEAYELIHGPPDRRHTVSDFEPYQHYMTDRMVEQDVFVGADMGLGKTAATLLAAKRLLDAGTVKHVLIVAPVRVAETTWPEEIAIWEFARSLTYTVITGTPRQRELAADDLCQINIVNRETVEWLKEHWRRDWPYDMLVYDEASRLKEGRKKTRGSVRKDGSVSHRKQSEFGVLANVRFRFKRKVLLSGTPAPKGLIDLWGPFYIIDKGVRLGKSKTKFLNEWFFYDRWKKTYYPRDSAFKEIMGRVQDVMFSMRSEDYLTLPPVVPVSHYVRLSDKQRADYKRLERDMLLEEYDVEAVNKGVLTNKLLQLCNGSLYQEDGELVALHDEKIPVLESIVTEANGAPVMVAYSFKFDLDRIKKRFPHARVFGDNENDARDWNEGKIDMLLIHPASAGHGLNFQYGGNIFVWYGLTWSLELWQQANKRLPRRGQKAKRVFMHMILCRGTAEEKMLAVLDGRAETQDEITDWVRVYADDCKRAA